jgi:hypothetical protein
MMGRVEGQIRIGGFIITKWRDELYIGRSDGEGGIFDERELEKAIEKFYREHF